MDRNGTDGVVDLEVALDEDDRSDHQHSGHGPDDSSPHRTDERAGPRDSNETGEQAAGGHGMIGLAPDFPYQKHRGQAARCDRKWGKRSLP